MKKVGWSLFILCIISLHISCIGSVREYLQKWSNTSEVRKSKILSKTTWDKGTEYISAAEPFKIELYVANPNKDILLQSSLIGAGTSFKITDSEGNNALKNYSETCDSTKTIIQISADLDPNNDGKTIILSGCIFPKRIEELYSPDKRNIDEIKKGNPEFFYTRSFIQKTPPDAITNLDNQEESHSYFQQTEKHFVSFTIPDQSKKWNMDAVYEICCYSKTNNSLIAKIEKPLSELSSYVNGTTFSYAFDEQQDNLYYNYTVQVKGKNGLKSSMVSTNSTLGEKILKPPVIVFTSKGNQITPNSQKDNDGFEYLEVESLDDTVDVTITSEQGSKVTGQINGSPVSAAANTYTKNLTEGNNTLDITIKQDGCQNVKVIRKIKVVQQLQEPSFKFYKDEGFSTLISKSTANEYEEVPNYSNYDYYNTKVNEGGNLYFNYTKNNSDDTVTLIESNKTYSKNYLPLGNHILNIKVQRQYYKQRTFTKYIYVQGLLEDAILQVKEVSSNGATQTVENNIPLWTYSYLKTDNVSFEVTPGNNGNTISEVKVNNTTLTKNNSNLYETDAFTEDKTIVIKQTKQHCKSKTTTKTVKVKIKPIIATVSTYSLDCYLTDSSDGLCEINGDLYLYIDGQEQKILKSFNKLIIPVFNSNIVVSSYPKIFSATDYSLTMDSPYSRLICSCNNLEEDDSDEGSENETYESLYSPFQLSTIINQLRSSNNVFRISENPYCIQFPTEHIQFYIYLSFSE